MSRRTPSDIIRPHITWSPFSSFTLAASKPSLSDGTHTIFLATQSACASPLLRKSFSKKRYLLSSAAGSAMSEISPAAVESEPQVGEAELMAGVSETAGKLMLPPTTGSASGGSMEDGLTSDLALISVLLKQQKLDYEYVIYTERSVWSFERPQRQIKEQVHRTISLDLFRSDNNIPTHLYLKGFY